MIRSVFPFLGAVAVGLAAACAPATMDIEVDLPTAPRPTPDARVVEVELIAAPGQVQLVASGPVTEVWAFNGTVPGPTIKAAPGDRVRVRFRNDLPEATTIHWHGLRVANAMDGTPAVMPPVEPGETFVYELDVPDAGLFWYHPHVNTHHQVERGLYGAFLVAEPENADVPIAVIDDWSLDGDNQIVPASAQQDVIGRTGDRLTVNSGLPAVLSLDGEGRRLHLLNGSNATPFAVEVPGHDFRVVAKDGPALDEPVELSRLRIAPGERFEVVMVPRSATASSEGELVVTPLSRGTMMGGMGTAGWTINGEAWPDVPPLEVAEGDPLVLEVSNATSMSHPLHIHGHFFRVLSRDSGRATEMPELDGDGEVLARLLFDRVESVAPVARPLETVSFRAEAVPLQPVRLGTSTGSGGMGGMRSGGGNQSADLRSPIDRVALQDTVEIFPGETVRLVFQADNIGDWLYHCHVLEHEEGGMMGVISVGR